MTTLYIIILVGLILIAMALLIFLFCGKLVYDKLNALFVMNTDIVLVILTIGFIDGRFDMYIDIAISYAVLGFVTTAILARYIGGRR